MSAAAPVNTGETVVVPAHLRHPASIVAKWLTISFTVLFLSAMILLPAANVFRQAVGLSWDTLRANLTRPHRIVAEIGNGIPKYFATFYVPEQADISGLSREEKKAYRSSRAQAEKTRDAIAMTLGIVAIAVPANVLFGLAAAWAITKFKFRGQTLLISLIDLPFAVSPVVSGLIFVLLMGRLGLFGDFATHWQWPEPLSVAWRGFGQSWFPFEFARWQQGIIFTPAASLLATMFVTFPFVARSLIPLMQSQGVEQEQAALTLGASGRQMFWRVTLPQIKWALLYGVILCTARGVGEFGAVSVVSGNTDPNDTMPLRIEKLWQEYNTQAAFAVASVLTGIALVTLLLKIIIERRTLAAMAEQKEEIKS